MFYFNINNTKNDIKPILAQKCIASVVRAKHRHVRAIKANIIDKITFLNKHRGTPYVFQCKNTPSNINTVLYYKLCSLLIRILYNNK